MNIGFDASRAFIGKKTGTENYSYQILTHLQKLDHTNNYYIYTKQNIPFPRLWTQAGLALQTFKDPLDILFIPAHTLPIIRKPGLKTVITVHDLGAEYLPGMHQLKQRLYLNFMTHHQLKSATHIIAVSEATKKDIIKKVGIDPKKITVIYEGYDKNKFQAIRNKEQTNQTIKKYNLIDHNYFLFVGTIQPRKNIKRLILAYNIFLKSSYTSKEPIIHNTSPISLVIAGSKGWLADEIYELPKKLGIEDKVKFLGYVPDQDLPALYSGAKAFLFPSLFEGFGLPILEAWACNCPVLTSNISSMKEIAQNAAILVNPYSVEDIAQGISKITNDQVTRNKLIKSGKEQLKNFSWEKAAQQTLQVLTK